jgi:hypothetical protein
MRAPNLIRCLPKCAGDGAGSNIAGSHPVFLSARLWRTRATAVAGVVCVCVLSGQGCAAVLQQTSPTSIEELWQEPGSDRLNLIDGVGADAAKPVVDARYQLLETNTGGFSTTYRVRDERGLEWSVKIGPEAQTEVVSSRIVWALGYHQVPSYFVERWIAVDAGHSRTLGGARFRPRRMPMKPVGPWSWTRNPFVGTRPYRGLIALMLVLNSTDLKAGNNELYEITSPEPDRPVRWYVVKDLGASLGETGRIDPRRGYLEGFERERFIVSAHKGQLKFGFRGRHKELLTQVRLEDVRWISKRLLRIPEASLRDAFHAGGYDDEQSRRYAARILQKAEEGMALR